MAGELIIKNGLITSGSIISTQGFTGSFSGSINNAITASNALTSSFPWFKTGNNIAYNNGGNIGIGTDNPYQSLLTLNRTQGNSMMQIVNASEPGFSYKIYNSGSVVLDNPVFIQSLDYSGNTNGYIGYNRGGGGNNGYLTFGDNGGERMRLTYGGNLLIGGTINSTYKLDVSGNVKLNGDSYLTGNVGIGVAVPQSKLHVEGSNVNFNLIGPTGNPTFRIANNVTGSDRKEFTIVVDNTNNRVDIQAVQQGVANRPITINASGGNVGIGTTSPSSALEVRGTLTVSGSSNILKIQGNSTKYSEIYHDGSGLILTPVVQNQYLSLGNSSSSKNWVNGIRYFGGDHTFYKDTGSISMFISSSGNIGIGTITPNVTVDIQSTTTGSIRISGSAGSIITFVRPTAGLTGFLRYLGSTMDIGTAGSDNLNFFTNNTLRATISPTGNFGVGAGVTSPSSRLFVKGSGTTNSTTALRVENSNASASMVVLDDGAVGIGTATPITKLDILGPDDTQGGVFKVNTTGGTELRVGGSSSYSWVQSFNNKPLSINPLGNNVGIGVTDPTAKLDISGELAIRGGEAADDARIYFRASDNSNRMQITTDLDSTPANDKLILRSNNVNSILVIRGNGNVHIGDVVTPTSKFEVLGDIKATTITASIFSGSFTGSLQGTGSWAVSASRAVTSSYALQALSASYAPGGTTFPYTGSAEISGSLIMSGSILVQNGSVGIVSTGTTNGSEAFKVQNATPEVLFDIKDDGELLINSTKYNSNGILENNNGIIQEIIGWSGNININTTPPVTIEVTRGIITNVL